MRQQSSFLILSLLVANGLAFAPQRPQSKFQTTSIPHQPLSLRTERSIRQDASPTALSLHPQLAVAAGAVSGGLFAGGLHAIAGPDHLAALLPRCCGQRWYRAGRVGALWGMGHGLSATLIGIIAFAVKKTFRNSVSPTVSRVLAGASHATELAVGASLILIGVMGLREAQSWKEEIMEGQPQSLSAAANESAGVKTAQKRAVILNGVLHGFSWDGAPSLAPALAVATWGGNLAFLAAYAAGTVGAMAFVTTLVGEGTRRAGEVFERPDLPQKLSFASSLLAIGIGVVWCGLGFR